MGIPADVVAAWYRVAYELTTGPIPEGPSVYHVYRVRHYVNPAHLEPVTHAESRSRSSNPPEISEQCRNGHQRADNNIRRLSNGKAQCRACDRDRKRLRRSA